MNLKALSSCVGLLQGGRAPDTHEVSAASRQLQQCFLVTAIVVIQNTPGLAHCEMQDTPRYVAAHCQLGILKRS
jgi:hypothetical protein